MRKYGKILSVSFILVLLIGIIGFLYLVDVEKKQENNIIKYDNINSGFFVWMDAYVALPINSDFDIAVTYYYFSNKDNYIHSDDISSIAFHNVSGIEINNFKIQSVTSNSDKYKGYSITLTVKAKEIGESSTDSLIIQLLDGAQYECPLGKWYFDVDTEDSGIVDAYSSSFATSSPQKFRYNYIFDDSYIISELKYWYNKKLDEPVEKSNIIDGIDSEAPFNYIKTKGFVKGKGEENIFYGLGSYCGILDASVDDIEISYERNKLK